MALVLVAVRDFLTRVPEQRPAPRTVLNQETRQAATRTPVPTALDRAAEDEHSEAGRAPPDGRHGAAA
jgi:hypothetical protein